MPTINLHHFKNHKKPYILQYIRNSDNSIGTYFLKTSTIKLSKDGSYGDYSCTVDTEGFYQIGNTRQKDCGCRLFFTSKNGNKFPFIRDENKIQRIKELIIDDIPINQIVEDLGLKNA